MKLTDILPVEEWIRIEDELIERTGLCAGIMDDENKRVTSNVKWANSLCPKIKGDPQGLAQICSVAQVSMAKEAEETGKSVIRPCDGSMIKIVTPIFVGDKFLGTAGGCGLLPENGEVESFFIAKVLDIPESEVDAAKITTLSWEKAEETALWLEKRIEDSVKV